MREKERKERRVSGSLWQQQYERLHSTWRYELEIQEGMHIKADLSSHPRLSLIIVQLDSKLIRAQAESRFVLYGLIVRVRFEGKTMNTKEIQSLLDRKGLFGNSVCQSPTIEHTHWYIYFLLFVVISRKLRKNFNFFHHFIGDWLL